MTKQVMYRYLGTNGVIESPVHLEDIYYTTFVNLFADAGKKLTNGVVYKSSVRVNSDEVNNWHEVDASAK